MSHSHTSSGSSTPDFYYSDQSQDSDTTPSPSGFRAPMFNPQVVSAKLTLYEASKSLYVAAETLTAAAQAMSKAAASLALASGNFSTEATFQKPRASEYHFQTGDLSPSPRSWSPEWQQTSYALPVRNTTSVNVIDPVDGATPAPVQLEPDQTLTTENESPPGPADQEDGEARLIEIVNEPDVDVAPPLPDVHDLEPTHIPPVQVQLEVPATTKSSNVPSSASQGGPNVAEKQPAASQSFVGGTEVPRTIKPETQPKFSSTAASTNPSSSSKQKVKPLAAAPPKPATTKPAINPPPQTKSCIILNRPSDEIPTAAFLCRQHPKTICFYKYWDAVPSLMGPFQVLVAGTVVGALSPKENRRTKAVNEFLQGRASVLFWPSHIGLPLSVQTALETRVQVVHIGELSQPNSGVKCARSTVVTTNRATSDMPKNQKNKFLKDFPIDTRNDAYNEQGATSPIHKFRVDWKASLAKKSPTRTLYTVSPTH
ncbi:hypothetical protein FS749_004941 [Ceratobasidium sp. UAMH 11750]|nr:hypothetical protein FS749_004941 [Ceratobasidium sp. UAMH 11750]